MKARVFVWLGGSIFVSALVYCGFAFLVSWSNAGAAGPRWSAVAADAALLTMFAMHHSFFARDAAKRMIARVIPIALTRSFYVWIASVLLIVACAAWQPIGGQLYDHTSAWARIAHAIVQLVGVGLIARAVATIDPLELAGIRPAAERVGLQVRGPYRLVRHPLYLGWVLALFGAAHMTADRFAFAVITTLYLAIAVPWEERSLRDVFGDEYVRYERRVRWRIVPFIY
jgi:protein-S-isoprenylcysteine O-methyltransferase Ste14